MRADERLVTVTPIAAENATPCDLVSRWNERRPATLAWIGD